ncbi:putative lipid-binding protein AIR1B [Mangifera indica]|uniref:putative lipid-binding protein AIR1B n=1 Tax=Mangifera indica TaxID=29780 RepID=UPI001CFB89B5|nr:putative lipid-binding protein AIR1B [Mangifera indica]
MASNKLYTAIFVLSLLFSSTLTSACRSCRLPPPTPVSPPPAENGSCPTLKLAACADLLGVVNVVVGNPPSGSDCCALIKGLADLEAALCLCTAIKTNVLGTNLNVPVTLGLLLSACSKTLPPNFQCPS